MHKKHQKVLAIIKKLRAPRASATCIIASAGLVGLAAATGAQPALAAAKPPAPAAPLAVGPSLSHQLLRLYAAYRHLPASDIAPVAPGTLKAVQTRGGRDWAMIRFRAARGAPLQVLTAFQDGASTGIFTRAPGRAWTVAGLGGEPMGCAVHVPAAVRHAWHLGSCPAPGTPPLEQPASQPPKGTIADLVYIALAQVGVSDDPASTSFGYDCNPYTTLVGAAGLGNCGVKVSHGSWFSNVKTHNEEWCSDFTKWVWEKAGVTSDLGTLTPYSGNFLTWGQEHGEHLSSDPGHPQVGDAVVIAVPGESPPDQHVGIVASVDSNGNVNLVDGDFLGSSNISVQYNQNVNLVQFAQSYGPGGVYYLVSPLLKTSSPPPGSLGVPGGPAVYDPLDGVLEVYGSGPGGSLAESFWAKGHGWLDATLSAAGPVSGRPSGVYDPLAQNLEVYATGSGGGDLVENYYHPGRGRGWRSQKLTGSKLATLTGSPSAVYDPASQHLEVYVTGADGQVQEFYWRPGQGGGWLSQQLPVTPSPVTGSPSAIYDPLDGVLEVYATGQDGRLEEDFWTKAHGWTGAELKATPSKLTGSPSAVYNPGPKNLEVYATGADGRLEELWYSPGVNWQDGELVATPSALTGSPSAVFDHLDNVLEVYATGADGHLEEDFQAEGKSWSDAELAPGDFTITGSPAAVDDPVGQHLEVYNTTSTSGLGEYYYAPGNGWHNQTLPSKTLTNL